MFSKFKANDKVIVNGIGKCNEKGIYKSNSYCH